MYDKGNTGGILEVKINIDTEWLWFYRQYTLLWYSSNWHGKTWDGCHYIKPKLWPWISNRIHLFVGDIDIQQSPNFNNGLAKSLFK